MKRLFSLILLLVYGVTSFGITLHLHYCCGKLDKLSFVSKAPTACKFENSIHNKGCCNNKDYELKIKADQDVSSNQIISFAHLPFTLFPVSSSNLFFFQKEPNLLSKGPPLILIPIPLFIKYCDYRI
jgi:hypothetical protein